MERCQLCGNPTTKTYLLDDVEVCKICYDYAKGKGDSL